MASAKPPSGGVKEDDTEGLKKNREFDPQVEKGFYGGDSDGRFQRVFAVAPGDFGAAGGFQALHLANIAAMKQEAISLGLTPTGPAEYNGHVKREDKGWDLAYSMPVVPAAINPPPEVPTSGHGKRR